MTDEALFSDTEQREFIESLPLRLSYSAIEEICRARFGEARTWPALKIADYWNRHHAPRRNLSKIYSDPPLREFIEDRVGRLTLSEIRAACLERFGPERAPSRTAIGEHWQRLRAARHWRERRCRSASRSSQRQNP